MLGDDLLQITNTALFTWSTFLLTFEGCLSMLVFRAKFHCKLQYKNFQIQKGKVSAKNFVDIWMI